MRSDVASPQATCEIPSPWYYPWNALRCRENWFETPIGSRYLTCALRHPGMLSVRHWSLKSPPVGLNYRGMSWKCRISSRFR